MSERKHSKLSPSGSHRWMKCPASVKFCENLKSLPTAYATEGTAAHQLAEYCLRQWVEPSIMIGTILEADGQKVEVTDDMAEAVTVYTDFVRSLASQDEVLMKSKLRYVEQEFDLSWLIPDTFGSNDCGIYDPKTKIMDVIDYKHGQGVSVDPTWNSQLLMYALGAMYEVWRSQTETTRKNFSMTKIVDKFRLHIVQPRSYQNTEEKIRTWEIDSITVLAWGVEVLQRSARATEDPNAVFESGEHCRFCPGLATCPYMVKHAIALAKTDFDNPVLPNPEALTPSDIAKILMVSEVFSTWAKEVKSFAAKSIAEGKTIPGYKLVRGKSDRRWINSENTANYLKPALGANIYTHKLISPAQAEKALKGTNYSIDGLWEKPEGSVMIVPESDKRKAIDCSNTAALDFLEVE